MGYVAAEAEGDDVDIVEGGTTAEDDNDREHDGPGADADDDADGGRRPPPPPKQPPLLPFWVLGLLNNAGYVIMLASAKSISEGGTALVFLANVLPALVVKLSAPYWFDRVGYGTRMAGAAALMGASFAAVGYFSGVAAAEGEERAPRRVVGMELLGVALGSLQGGLGEASLLALAGRYDSLLPGRRAAAAASPDGRRGGGGGGGEKGEGEGGGGGGRCITAFSSGTGLAGVFGFAYKVLLTDWLGMSLGGALYAANGLAALYWLTYRRHLGGAGAGGPAAAAAEEDEVEARARSGGGGSERGVELYLLRQEDGNEEDEDGNEDGDGDGGGPREGGDGIGGGLMLRWKERGRRRQRRKRERYAGLETSDPEEEKDNGGAIEVVVAAADEDWPDDDDGGGASAPLPDGQTTDVSTLTTHRRFRLTLSLWPYMIPLFTVYAAEYALQSGTWTAIGFPVDSAEARDKFYEYSNWTYQAGVFLSRSSGTLFTASLPVLWLMPLLQCLNLIFFYFVAATHAVLYGYALLVPCFYAGLLGGAVYVNGYNRINADLPPREREFALSAASVADSFGILAADASGLFLQSCLYRRNGIDGAVVRCPFGGR